MQVGIIAEGWSDVAVIRNILKGLLGIDKFDTISLLPNNQVDETFPHMMGKDQFSNWTLVRQSCMSGEHHSKFIEAQKEEHFLIVHLDTDMRKEIGFDVHLPETVTNHSDIDELVGNVVGKLREWLKPEFASKTVFAIAVEETEAWILALYSDAGETGFQASVKEHLQKVLNKTTYLSRKEKQAIFSTKDRHIAYTLMSYGLRKKKNLDKCMTRNRSLAHFCNSLTQFDKGNK